MTISIVLADDHPVLRLGLRVLLSAEPDLEVVGEAGDGDAALALVEQLHPQVLLLDLVMPGLDGLEVVRQAAQRCPQTRVVVLSMHAHEAYIVQALRGGALAYVPKDSPATAVVDAVRAAAAGERVLSPTLSENDVQAYIDRKENSPFDLHETLTPREREVFRLAAEGLTSREIAARLFLSPRTVERHRANMMRKLDLQSQTELVRYAVCRGFLPLEQ